MSYKTRVPVRGVIMLNVGMDKAVLVKGWKSGASWSFPRGKIDQNEDDRDCAIRETYEETGFDLTGMVGSKDKIDINIREQDMRLYIAPGVPEDFEFAPRTRKEISVCDRGGFSVACVAILTPSPNRKLPGISCRSFRDTRSRRVSENRTIFAPESSFWSRHSFESCASGSRRTGSCGLSNSKELQCRYRSRWLQPLRISSSEKLD